MCRLALIQRDTHSEGSKEKLVRNYTGASQVALVVKNLPANAGDTRDTGLIPWRRAWQSTPVFLPGESHGQRSLAGYSPWSHKELDMTEQLSIAYTLQSPGELFKNISVT